MQFEHDDALRSAIRRAKIVKVDDSQSQQRVDIEGLKNEKPKKIFRPMDFGYTSVPPKDTEGVMIQMGGRSDRTLYFDGGHKDYRPKNFKPGESALFDQWGDIIRHTKDVTNIVHSKKINLALGKGYDAKDVSDRSGPSVSIVIEDGAVTITHGSSTVKLEQSQITLTSPKVVIDSPQTHLGGDGGTLVGLCGGGCATKVWAV